MTLEEMMALATEKPKKVQLKKFKATAYEDRSHKFAIDGLDSDEWQMIAEFLVDGLAKGYCVEICNNVTEGRKSFYPEDLLDDLRLEQQEQM